MGTKMISFTRDTPPAHFRLATGTHSLAQCIYICMLVCMYVCAYACVYVGVFCRDDESWTLLDFMTCVRWGGRLLVVGFFFRRRPSAAPRRWTPW